MEFKVFAEHLNFPEGPVALEDGSVLVVELKNQQLKRFNQNGTQDVIVTVQGAQLPIGLGEFTFLDSMAADTEGNVSVATMPKVA